MKRLYEIEVKVTETHRIYKEAEGYKEAQHAIEDSLHAQEEGRDVQVVYVKDVKADKRMLVGDTKSYRHLDQV
jgi:hypothetical protein|tara:strand:+ start:117 stop:335 length:219 start_codon:yes stop_codon:yes gene_type:complete